MILISHPRSGTHLLAHILGVREFATYKGVWTLTVRQPKAIKRVLSNGSRIWVHYPYNDTLREFLEGWDGQKRLLLRDPRDIIVSIAHFVEACPGMYLNYIGGKQLSQMPFVDRVDWLIDVMRDPLYDHDRWRKTGLFQLYYYHEIVEHPAAASYNYNLVRGIVGGYKQDMTKKQIDRADKYYGELIEVWT